MSAISTLDSDMVIWLVRLKRAWREISRQTPRTVRSFIVTSGVLLFTCTSKAVVQLQFSTYYRPSHFALSGWRVLSTNELWPNNSTVGVSVPVYRMASPSGRGWGQWGQYDADTCLQTSSCLACSYCQCSQYLHTKPSRPLPSLSSLFCHNNGATATRQSVKKEKNHLDYRCSLRQPLKDKSKVRDDFFYTISVKARWERWCRWNCDLRVINARKKAFSVVPKASPWRPNNVTICLLRHSGESLQNGQLELRRRNWYFARETFKVSAVSVWSGRILKEYRNIVSASKQTPCGIPWGLRNRTHWSARYTNGRDAAQQESQLVWIV